MSNSPRITPAAWIFGPFVILIVAYFWLIALAIGLAVFVVGAVVFPLTDRLGFKIGLFKQTDTGKPQDSFFRGMAAPLVFTPLLIPVLFGIEWLVRNIFG